MMSVRTVLLLLVAVATATVTALYARNWLDTERAAMLANAPAEAVVAPAKKVLVAKIDLTAGSFVSKEDLEWRPWPEEGIIESYAVQGERESADFIGTVVRTAMIAGQPLTDARVVYPGDRGFLAAVLDPGKRAVSVPVNATSGIAGFVFPGDWVDVILTVRFRVEDENGKNKNRYFSETLLSDVRVLAIDQAVDNEEAEVAVAKTATLEVTPKHAEKIAIGLEMGSLSLSLHSLARTQDRFSKVARTIGADPDETGNSRSYTMDFDVYYMRDDLFADTGTESRRKQQVNVLRGGDAETAVF